MTSPHTFTVEHFPEFNLALMVPEPESVRSSFAQGDDGEMVYWTRIWPGSLALARQILANKNWSGKWLELGAGLGLPGLTLAKHYSKCQVMLTDLSLQAAILLKANAARNELDNVGSGQMDIREIDADELRFYDGLLVADLAYEAALHPALHKLVENCISLQKTIWLALPQRAETNRFLEGLRTPPAEQHLRSVNHAFGRTEVLLARW